MPAEQIPKKLFRPSVYGESKPKSDFMTVVPTGAFNQMTINPDANTVSKPSVTSKVFNATKGMPSNTGFKPIGGKTRKCKNDATYVWLNLWFKSEFEKLGWMVLAKHEGQDDKVYAYVNSVQRLYHQLECKIRTTKDHDRKQDLQIMYKNVKCLIDHIHKDF